MEARRGTIEVPERRRASGRSGSHWATLGLAVASLAALFVLGTAVTPSPEGHGTHEQLGLPPCMAMRVFGVPCPGCGVTTSVSLFAHGHPIDALRTQPFGVLVVLGMAGIVSIAAWGVLARRDVGPIAKGFLRTRWLAAAGACLAAAWIYKLAVVLG